MLFIKPPLSVYEALPLEEYRYSEKIPYRTYAEYNYLRPGLASRIKIHHFEVCLRLTAEYFGDNNVIDFGCADGVFLPSLSKYFKNIVGIDRTPKSIQISEALIKSIQLNNVTLICNDHVSMDALVEQLSERRYKILYLLETLEHVGTREAPWESRVDFLKKVSRLLEAGGLLVITVPKMVGPAFLLQRMGLALLGAYREPISLKNLLKAGLFNNTTELEQNWDGNHLGFNHIKLEKCIRKHFQIVKKVDIFFQVVYILLSNPQI